MKPYDLHNHSKLSKDGHIPAKDIIDFAAKRGLRGIGISDHDEFRIDADELFSYANEKGIKLALGPEISCEAAHIIGYNMTDISIDDNLVLDTHFNTMRSNYFDIAKTLVNRLKNEYSIPISVQKIQDKYSRDNFQKLHVMVYLAEEIQNIRDKQGNDIHFDSWGAARKWVKNEPDGLYQTEADSLEKPFNPFEVVKIIKRSGGIAIWAHPFITPEPLRTEYFRILPEAGLDAIEASYAYKENGYAGEETNEELDVIVRSKIKELGLAVSGGSDSHIPFKKFKSGEIVMPGDFGITEEEAQKLLQVFGN